MGKKFLGQGPHQTRTKGSLVNFAMLCDTLLNLNLRDIIPIRRKANTILICIRLP